MKETETYPMAYFCDNCGHEWIIEQMKSVPAYKERCPNCDCFRGIPYRNPQKINKIREALENQ